jgi:uncharacterized membrane protein YdjX (TVP38/TMEM64 family)
MSRTPAPLRRALTWRDLWPSVRAGLGVLALFVVALLLVRAYTAPIQSVLGAHAPLGVVVFVATSVVAVLLPMLTNLPLLPLAVLAWGPWWTAGLLLAGWVIGAALSFALGRHARDAILRHFPSVRRHADIDRLIHPRHRMISLVLLRMTFPVDVLSYALGLFSRSTTLAENAVSTALGAAPFALLFAWIPALPLSGQAVVFVASALVFVAYAAWVLRRPDPLRDVRAIAAGPGAPQSAAPSVHDTDLAATPGDTR